MDINKLPDPVIIINRDNKIVGLNDKARELGFDFGMDFVISESEDEEIEVGGEIYSVRFSDLNGERIVVLRKESDFHRTLIELFPDGIIIHDGQKILFANRRAAEVAGIPPERLIGTSVMDFVHPDYMEFAFERIKKMLQGGDGSSSP